MSQSAEKTLSKAANRVAANAERRSRRAEPVSDPPAGNEIKVTADAYFGETQFCERFRIARRTAQRWRVTGEGPPYLRLGPRCIVYRARDCEIWAAGRTFAHRAEELAKTGTRT